MPEKNGFEVLKEVRMKKDTPILVLSSSAKLC
jgi:DNA-binding response OmpR family regulator